MTETEVKTLPLGIQAIQESYASLKGRLSPLAPNAMMRRDAAASSAAALGFPNTRHEDWRYTSLRPLLEKGFKVPGRTIYDDLKLSDFDQVSERLIEGAIRLVFVDGELSVALSDTRRLGEGLSIKTLFEAEGHDESTWRDWDSLPGLNQVFAQMAVGFADHGIVIKIAPRLERTITIHILHVSSSASAGISRSSRVIVETGRLSQVRVYEEFVSMGDISYHSNTLTQIVAKESSNVGYYRMDQSGTASFLTGQVTVSLERDAKVETFSLASGSRWNRTNIDAVYLAPGGECILDGLYMLRGEQHIDHHTMIDHSVPQCHTRQLYKGILAGRSRAVFNGKVFIRRGASESRAFQTNKNLLLSLESEVDTKPELLIDNDDVKASHGAAIGAIDAKELFYLQSRGIDRAEAEAILSRGFADEVVLRVEDLVAQKVLGDRVARWFSDHRVEA